MIIVKVFRKNNQITAFECSGHAESGPYGYDLVCAGVSAVSFGTVNAIDKLCEIDLEIEQADEGGYLHVSIPHIVQQELCERVQLLLEGMLVSLTTIEREYSQFIKIDSK
jgi:uncharacterized protein YsxB (DUF464 family)